MELASYHRPCAKNFDVGLILVENLGKLTVFNDLFLFSPRINGLTLER